MSTNTRIQLSPTCWIEGDHLFTTSAEIVAQWIGQTVKSERALDPECQPDRYNEETDEYERLPIVEKLISVCTDHAWLDDSYEGTPVEYPLSISLATAYDIYRYREGEPSVELLKSSLLIITREEEDPLDIPSPDYLNTWKVLHLRSLLLTEGNPVSHRHLYTALEGAHAR